MKSDLRCALAVAVILWLGAVASAGEVAAAAPGGTVSELAANVPDGAVVVVAGRSINECRGGLKAFVDQITPGQFERMGDPVRGFISDTGNGGGLNGSGVMAAIIMPNEQNQPMSVTLVAIADYAVWRESWGDGIKKEKGIAYEYLEGPYGGRQYFAHKGGFVAFSDAAEGLDTWSKALATPLGGDRRKAFEAALAAAPFAADVSLVQVRKMYPNLSNDINNTFSQLPLMGPGAGAPAQQQALSRAISKMANDVVTGIDEIVVAAAPSAEGLTVSAQVWAAPGTVVYDIMSQQGLTDTTGLAFMPKSSMLLFAGGMRGDAAWKYITDMSADLAEAVAEKPEESEANRTAIVDAIKKIQESGAGQVAVGALLGPQAGQGFAATAMYRVDDSEKARSTFVDFFKDPKTNTLNLKMAMVSGMKLGDVQVTEEVAGDTKVTVVKQPIDLSAAPAMQRRMYDKMFGQGMVTRIAARDKWLYVALGEKDTLMKGLLAGEANADHVDAGKLKKSLAPFGGKVSDIELFSLPDYIMWAMSISPLFTTSAPTVYAIPPSGQYTGMALTFEQGKATARLVVPTEEILATKGAFEEMQKQQRQQYMRGQEQSTASTLEAPAPPAGEVEAPGNRNEKQDSGAGKTEASVHTSAPVVSTVVK